MEVGRTRMSPPLSHRDLILVAATTFGSPFTPADLAVRAWEKYPEAFGLAGYRENFPAADKVFSKLYGSTGLILRGHVRWADGSNTLLEVTHPGRLFAADLEAGRKTNVPAQMRAPRGDESWLAFRDIATEAQATEFENARLRRENARLRAEREAGWTIGIGIETKETGT